ncbi:MAG: hypothetical protein U5J64_11235 [Halobacteriales archaeon]|nr:hypothetical protein [Halobacteriales archaeon]
MARSLSFHAERTVSDMDREHVESKIHGMELPYFRQFVLDIWGLRGFGVAYRYEGEEAEFVAVRGRLPTEDETDAVERDGMKEETEVVSVAENGEVEDVHAVSEAKANVEGTDETRSVAVAGWFEPDACEKARELGVETVDAERLTDLVVRGGYYWTLYRWVAHSEADEPEVVETGEAPLRRGQDRDNSEGIVLGRATANRLGVRKGDVVRVAGEIAGVARKGGMLETERDYVSVSEGDTDAIDADEGDAVTVEVIEAEEARRVYVLSEPEMEADLALDIWKGYAPHRGTELSQTYEGGEIRTMALEVLPHDYCYVSAETDVVVEGYAGARRVFE